MAPAPAPADQSKSTRRASCGCTATGPTSTMTDVAAIYALIVPLLLLLLLLLLLPDLSFSLFLSAALWRCCRCGGTAAHHRRREPAKRSIVVGRWKERLQWFSSSFPSSGESCRPVAESFPPRRYHRAATPVFFLRFPNDIEKNTDNNNAADLLVNQARAFSVARHRLLPHLRIRSPLQKKMSRREKRGALTHLMLRAFVCPADRRWCAIAAGISQWMAPSKRRRHQSESAHWHWDGRGATASCGNGSANQQKNTLAVRLWTWRRRRRSARSMCHLRVKSNGCWPAYLPSCPGERKVQCAPSSATVQPSGGKSTPRPGHRNAAHSRTVDYCTGRRSSTLRNQ